MTVLHRAHRLLARAARADYHTFVEYVGVDDDGQPLIQRPLDRLVWDFVAECHAAGAPAGVMLPMGFGKTTQFCYRAAWEIGRVEPVLDTLVYLKHETDVWFEITTLLIPGENDSEEEIEQMTEWVVERLGPDVPMHFTAFHPDWKMMDHPHTPPATLIRAREIALKNGVRYAYTGNVHDKAGGSTYCHVCGETLVGRDWYVLSDWALTADGACRACGTPCPGVLEAEPGTWGAKRQRVRLGGVMG